MAGIDSLLRLVIDQGANELRLAASLPPRMFASGSPKRLTMPATGEAELRYLLGDLLSDDRDAVLTREGQLELSHKAGALGEFHVALALRPADGGRRLEATFVKAGTSTQPAAAPAPAPAPQAPPPPPAQAVPLSVHAHVRTDAHVHQRAAEAPVAERAATRGPSLPTTTSPPLHALLARAAQARASDLHLCTGELPYLRVDGALRPLDDEGPADVAALLSPWLDEGVTASLARGGSLDRALASPGVGRFRLHVYQSSSGLTAALRALPERIPTLDELGVPQQVVELIDLPHGLVLFCGPTGSGKSTTLASLASEGLRRRPELLVTLEDPIEYVIAGRARGSLVRQREVGRDVRDFASGLRDALREDPDMLLIGEVRDQETIGLAMTAAETGHLVLTTLHSASTASSVERVIDAYPPERAQQVRGQLADSLRAVVAQRLVPRKHGGRALAVEVLRVTHAVAAMIREGRTAQLATAMQAGRREGMVQLEASLAELVRSGVITEATARTEAGDLATLAGYLR